MRAFVASPTPVSLSRLSILSRRVAGAANAMAALTRGGLLTLVGHVASLARPIGIAWFSHAYGARTLGAFLLLWTSIELGSRVATLGLDRGVQRWADARRVDAAVAGMVLAAIAGIAIAVGLAHLLPLFGVIDPETLEAARPVLLVGLPLTAVGNVALRAPRGPAQIATFVVARGVTEPLLLLLSGLVLSSRCDGSVALPAALLISIVGGVVVAAVSLVRTFGTRALFVTPRAWPIKKLVRSSIPLGVADALQTLQAKLDLIAVAIVTFSAHAITAYAVAAEVAAVFTVIRTGFDQVVVPIAVDARADRGQLARVLATATRWSLFLAAPIAFAILVAPDAWLEWFGGSSEATVVLLVLALGRAIELALGPASSMLAAVADPRLPLVDALAGVLVAIVGQVTLGLLGFGPNAIALASAAGTIVSSALAAYWLVSLAGPAGFPAALLWRRQPKWAKSPNSLGVAPARELLNDSFMRPSVLSSTGTR